MSAHGKRHRYRYYACWTTRRYGKKACTGERLRADALEDAVLTALVDLYSDPELIARALKANQQSSADTARQQREELAATEAEIAKTDSAVDRYMHAFEAGTLTADIFADRVRDLGDKARALRLRHAELGRAAVEVEAPLPTLAEVTTLRDQLRDVALHGPGRVRKAVAQAFVHSLTVESRDRILPKFQVRRGLIIEQTGEHDGNPSQGSQERGVRAMTPTVVVTPSNTNHRLTVRGPTIQLRRHQLLPGSCREAMLTTMRADGRHDLWTTTKVHAAIAAIGTTWSKQTVYKTLHRMVNDGILVQGDNGFVLAACKSPLRRRGL